MDAPQVPTPGHMYEYYSREKYSIEDPSSGLNGPSTANSKQWGNTGQASSELPGSSIRVIDYSNLDGQAWGTHGGGNTIQGSYVSDNAGAVIARQSYNNEIQPPTPPPQATYTPFPYPYNQTAPMGEPSPEPLLPVEETKQKRPGPYCGLPRRDFWILISIATGLAIGAIVGGVLGAVTIKQNETAAAATRASDINMATSTPTAVPSQTSPGTAETASSLPRADRSIAASTVPNNSTSSNYQVVYQDLTTFELRYRLVWDDKPASEQNLTLDLKPDRGTPIAIVAANSTLTTENIMLFIFYTTCEDKSDMPLLAVASLECIPGALTCSEIKNNPIPASSDLGAKSELAAVVMEDGQSLRVYYQASNGWIYALSANTTNVDVWTPTRLSGPAIDGSAIAASVHRSTSQLQVIYVCSETRMLRCLEYEDASGADEGMSELTWWAQRLQANYMSRIHRRQNTRFSLVS